MVVDYDFFELMNEVGGYDESPIYTKESPLTDLTSSSTFATYSGSPFPSTIEDVYTYAAVNLTAGGDEKECAARDIAVSILLLVVFVIGTIGVFLAIFVILTLAEYKKFSTHWYVLQLVMADLIFLLTIPLRATEDLHCKWIFSEWTCKAKETMFFLNYYASVLFLLLMASERYIVTCYRSLQKLCSRSFSCIATVLIWIVSILLCIPAMAFSTKAGTDPACKCKFLAADILEVAEICSESGYRRQTAEFERCVDELSIENNRKCRAAGLGEMNITIGNLTDDFQHPGCHFNRSSTFFKGIIYFNFVVMFIIPSAIMAVCYTLIAKQQQKPRGIYQNTEDLSQYGLTISEYRECKQRTSKYIASGRDNPDGNRTSRMCACLAILFVCCWLPFHMVHLVKISWIDADDRYCKKLFHDIFTFAHFSISCYAASLPYLYVFVGSKPDKLRHTSSSSRKTKRIRSSSSSLQARSMDAGCKLNLDECEMNDKMQTAGGPSQGIPSNEADA